jgi:hypothetical protein
MSEVPDIVLETVLTRLAALFLIGACGDTAAARHAALQMLATYRPETTDELRLAANIIGFSFQALEALSQAATPDMPLTRILRLRGSAVSLSRESAKAERRLNQLQRARQEPIQAQQTEVQPEPEPGPKPEPEPRPKVDKAVALIQQTGKIALAAKANKMAWTQAYEQHQRDTRRAASLQKAEARIAAQANAAIKQHPSQTTADAAA